MRVIKLNVGKAGSGIWDLEPWRLTKKSEDAQEAKARGRQLVLSSLFVGLSPGVKTESVIGKSATFSSSSRLGYHHSKKNGRKRKKSRGSISLKSTDATARVWFRILSLDPLTTERKGKDQVR